MCLLTKASFFYPNKKTGQGTEAIRSDQMTPPSYHGSDQTRIDYFICLDYQSWDLRFEILNFWILRVIADLNVTLKDASCFILLNKLLHTVISALGKEKL